MAAILSTTTTLSISRMLGLTCSLESKLEAGRAELDAADRALDLPPAVLARRLVAFDVRRLRTVGAEGAEIGARVELDRGAGCADALDGKLSGQGFGFWV